MSGIEALRAGLGALIGLGLTGLFVLSPTVDVDLGLYLVAPFGATSVLLFALPNSPLAQPWSAIVGNTVAALVAVAVCLLVTDPVLRIALAVGLAITATILCRAIHPPAGAVAMTAAMSPDAIADLGFWFALTPIALGTALLVLIAALYARLTGRRYPFRQFDAPGKHGTDDRNPTERLGLSEDDLTAILDRYRQSFNIGVEDLARLIGAAELQAAAQSGGRVVAADIMSRNLVTIGPETPLSEIADLFRHHRFTCLPVVGADQGFQGLIFQIHLISETRASALADQRGFAGRVRHWFRKGQAGPMTAADIMSVAGPRADADTPVGALLPMMADGDTDAVPVLDQGRIIGIVTRTDLIATLARSAARAELG